MLKVRVGKELKIGLRVYVHVSTCIHTFHSMYKKDVRVVKLQL